MNEPTAGYPQRDKAGRQRPPSQEQRIRWERDQKDTNRIVVTDAVTGVVIAIVRSLFDIGRK
jgi:hypothetical protein